MRAEGLWTLRHQRSMSTSSSASPEEPPVVLVAEGAVDPDEGLLLLLGEVRIATDLPHQIGAFALLEDPRPDVERLRGDLEGPGDLLEDLGRRLPQTALDLAQVGVGDARHLGQLAQREVAHPTLVADELPEVVPAVLELLLHRARLRDSREQPLVGRELLEQRVDGRLARLVATGDLRLQGVDAIEEVLAVT